ncbi:O-antigen ligase [Chromobacterium sp. IIBBL 290-4]|uniref:O-antigen ligase family protein n=1 Tax=Chromobacterium sp. IIBBL 290-4 TaxID=2953890 RepID=UPI0020B7BFE0|nr:O-antigen ligase family protein [Chromobacterium sp. IIBBL 290-4]UTH72842.1 O-antigen ligase family protein [Chromobacterium sp. IIBBL 290-4]
MSKSFMLRFFLMILPLQFIILLPLGDKGSGIRLYHVVGMVAFCLFVLFRFYAGRFLIFRTVKLDVLFYFSGIVLVEFFNSSSRDYFQLVLPVFAFLSYLIGAVALFDISERKLNETLKNAALVFFLIVFLKNIFFLPELLSTFNQGQEALIGIPWITAGGPNIESTVLVMMLSLFIGSRRMWWLSGLVFLSCILYQSRTSTLLFLFICALHVSIKYKGIFRLSIFLAGFAAFISVVAASGISNRFENVSDEFDESTVGRYFLWTSAVDLIQDNYLGYGLGEGVQKIESEADRELAENNFHNIYLQSAVDSGVIFSALLLLIAARRIYASIKSGSTVSPYDLIVCMYFISGFVQFTGYDAIGWLFIGIADSMRSSTFQSKIITSPLPRLT